MYVQMMSPKKKGQKPGPVDCGVQQLSSAPWKGFQKLQGPGPAGVATTTTRGTTATATATAQIAHLI